MQDGGFYLHDIKIEKKRKKRIRDHTTENRCDECGKLIDKPYAFVSTEDYYKISKGLLCSSQCINNYRDRIAKWHEKDAMINCEIKINN
jgi:hypothetical protein